MTIYSLILSIFLKVYKKGISSEIIISSFRTLLSIISFSSWWVIVKIYLKLLSKKHLTATEFTIIGVLCNGTLCYFIENKYNRKNLTTFTIMTGLS
jgi:hypothetical protein